MFQTQQKLLGVKSIQNICKNFTKFPINDVPNKKRVACILSFHTSRCIYLKSRFIIFPSFSL